MADHWFQSTGRFGLLKVIAPSLFDGFSRERWQTLIEHLKSNVMEKVSDNLLLFSRNLQANGAQFFWDTLYKLYVRPHLDYGDIIYHKYDPDMQLNFTQQLEQTQYKAALAVTGAWMGTSRQRMGNTL